ncbi:hypothetical protein ACFU8Q_22080 [Streptomyces sp. NPDC057543]
MTVIRRVGPGIYLRGGEIASLGPRIVFHAGPTELVASHLLLGPEGRRPP